MKQYYNYDNISNTYNILNYLPIGTLETLVNIAIKNKIHNGLIIENGYIIATEVIENE